VGETLQLLKDVLQVPGLLKEIYGDLAKPGVTQAGKALSTVIGLGNTILLPIHWANERTRLAVESNLEKYRKCLEAVPEEEITSVRPEIGVPILEKLSYVTDEELSDLYVNLLAKASCVDTVQFAHPSFVNVINHLSPDEAVLLREIHRQNPLLFLTLKLSTRGEISNMQVSGWRIEDDLLTGVETKIGLSFPNNIPAYFSNFKGLGLTQIRRDVPIFMESLYESLITFYQPFYQPVFKSLGYDREEQLRSFEKGWIEITPFGGLFMSACMTKLRQSK
jgi:hypothetical protein